MRVVVQLAVTLLGIWWLLTPAPAAAADWVLPLPGEPHVTRPFDPPGSPYGRGHRGVDLAGTPALPVRAAGEGTIGYAAPLAGRGVVTVLHGGGLRTTYEPVAATVRVGELVPTGHPIGTLQAGHPGCPVAACLHWGLLRGEVYLDPMSLLSLGPIRLLPSADPAGEPSADRGGAATASDERAAPRANDELAIPGGPPVPRVGAAVTAVTGLAVGAAVLRVRPRPP
ncbi:MAG: M23 family metallopeptidase [Geodermatophilaceae bacterium]|nr:M23 family metallopeptidase [Geodermatophilaceae bacterium]